MSKRLFALIISQDTVTSYTMRRELLLFEVTRSVNGTAASPRSVSKGKGHKELTTYPSHSTTEFEEGAGLVIGTRGTSQLDLRTPRWRYEMGLWYSATRWFSWLAYKTSDKADKRTGWIQWKVQQCHSAELRKDRVWLDSLQLHSLTLGGRRMVSTTLLYHFMLSVRCSVAGSKDVDLWQTVTSHLTSWQSLAGFDPTCDSRWETNPLGFFVVLKTLR